jgi:hypothetical protein
MLTADLVRVGLTTTAQLERAIKALTKVETDPSAQRRALAVFRHAHALRLALEHWQDAEQ